MIFVSSLNLHYFSVYICLFFSCICCMASIASILLTALHNFITNNTNTNNLVPLAPQLCNGEYARVRRVAGGGAPSPVPLAPCPRPLRPPGRQQLFRWPPLPLPHHHLHHPPPPADEDVRRPQQVPHSLQNKREVSNKL